MIHSKRTTTPGWNRGLLVGLPLTVVSVVGRDFPVIQGIAITTSAVFVFINIIVDLVAYMIDPRVEL